MAKKLKLSGKNVFIREWEVTDAKSLCAIADVENQENAEVRIIDWMLKFEQTRLGTLPLFNLKNELIAIISLLPRIKKQKAIFEIQIVAGKNGITDLEKTEARTLLSDFASEILGITEINEPPLSER